MREHTTTYYSENEPTDPQLGDVWFDTFDHKTHAYDGLKWITLDPE